MAWAGKSHNQQRLVRDTAVFRAEFLHEGNVPLFKSTTPTPDMSVANGPNCALRNMDASVAPRS